MKRFFLISFVFYLSNFLVSDDKKIEDCTLIANDKERLSCFDSFFKTDKKLNNKRFDNSNLNLSIQQATNDTYLKGNKLSSPIITNYDVGDNFCIT